MRISRQDDRQLEEKAKRLVMQRLYRTLGSRVPESEFWQSLTDSQRFDAVWQIAETMHELKGGHPDELKMNKSFEVVKSRGK